MSHSDGWGGVTIAGTPSSRSNGRAQMCEAHLGFSVFPHPVRSPCRYLAALRRAAGAEGGQGRPRVDEPVKTEEPPAG